MSKKTYEWLLFDADGTLFDYDEAEIHALEASFQQIAIPFEQRYLQEYRKINDQIWRDFEQGEISQERLKTERFERLFKTLHIQADAIRFSEIYLENLSKSTYLMTGAEDLLESLRGKFRIAIITNGLTKVQKPRFKASSISHYFEEIIISEEVGAAKPSPEIFDIAFARMHYPGKDNVLIIGDSLTSDIQGGNDYGIDTCWFNPTGQPKSLVIPSTFEIHRLQELTAIINVM